MESCRAKTLFDESFGHTSIQEGILLTDCG